MSTIEIERPRPQIAVLRLNRPERLNAISWALVRDLHEALDAIDRDNRCRVVVLTGAGRGFCAGLDLRDQGNPGEIVAGVSGPRAGLLAQNQMASLIPHMRRIQQPLVAAINGVAYGGGFALALGCDVRVAARSAKLCTQFIRVGVSGCDIGVSWLLPRLIGASRAYELMLTGRFLAVDEAHASGLVHAVVPDGTVVDAALGEAELILANSPFGVQMTKEVMWSQLEIGSLAAGIDLENRTQMLAGTTSDMAEAVAAFLAKRPPRYTDQ